MTIYPERQTAWGQLPKMTPGQVENSVDLAGKWEDGRKLAGNEMAKRICT